MFKKLSLFTFFALLLFVAAVLIVAIADSALAQRSVPDKVRVERVEIERMPTNQWAVRLEAGVDADAFAAAHGFVNLGQVGLLEGVFLFEAGSSSPSEGRMLQGEENTAVLWAMQQTAVRQHNRGTITDPLAVDQWHLDNRGQSGGTVGVDINILPVWEAGWTGDGVVIGVVDDGLEHAHPDIAPNYVAAGSYDFNDDDPDPNPVYVGDAHGTAAGGVAAASADGSSCGVGAAYNASLTGLKLIADPAGDAQEASALNYRADLIDIYNNSWGPADVGFDLSGPGPLVAQALAAGVEQGRGGLGSIFMWAAGNGLEEAQNVNYDGYANSPYTIAVGAIDHDGIQAPYSEPGAAMFVTAPSDGDVSGITTTDLLGADGYEGGDCTSTFGGTSSATPLVAGVVATMLEANPNLSWRDVQHILARTAVVNDPTDPDWTNNGAGFFINHKYGFGQVDATAALIAAQEWGTVPEELVLTTGTMPVNLNIPDEDFDGVVAEFEMTENLTLEHVEIFFEATHTYRGDLEIILESPDGTLSVLAEQRDDSGQDYVDATTGQSWRFMTVRNWGESSLGTWRIYVADLIGGDVGTFVSWEIVFYGTGGNVQYLPVIVD